MPAVPMLDEKILTKKFTNLISDIEWQKSSLLEYIRNTFIKKPTAEKAPSVLETALQNVLDAYLQMADRFYLQFRDSLRNAYIAGSASDLSNPKNSISENDIPFLMQQALDKLVAEWERVYDFIVAHSTAKSMGSVEKLQLLPVINAAILDIGFSPESCLVIPELSSAYSLGFFNYADDFLPLSVPLTRVRSPWEWTIFWHEIAGQKIRLLKNIWLNTKNMYEEMFLEIISKPELYPKEMFGKGKGLSKEYQSNLALVRESCDSILVTAILPKLTPLGMGFDDLAKIGDFWEPLSEDLVEFLNHDSRIPALTYTEKYFTEPSPSRPMFMLSFNALFTQAMSALPAPVREKALVNGWGTDWLEELFEDSFSTMNFDFNFIFILDHLLRRSQGGKGLRHPTREVRLAAALSMKLIGANPELKKYANPPRADEWHIPSNSGLSREDVDLLKKFDPTLLLEEGVVVWQFAKKIVELHEWMNIQHPDDNNLIEGVKAAISQAMVSYVHNKDLPLSIASLAEKTIKKLKVPSFLDQVALRKRKFKGGDRKTKIGVLLQSKSVLNRQPLSYHELLALQFYDVDWLETTITEVKQDDQDKFQKITWMKVLSDEVKDGTVGPVTYKVDGNSRATTVVNWNVDFKGSAYEL